MLSFARNRGMMTGVAALHVGGSPPPASGFVALAHASVDSPASGSTFTANCATNLAAGAIAVAAFFANGAQSLADFRDSVDPSTAWTSFGEASSGGIRLKLFKRIVPVGGFNASTVFTATLGLGSSIKGGGIVVGGFADATGIPTSTDSTATQANGGSTSLAVNGPSISTSYQFAAIVASHAGVSGPDATSDASWTFDHAVSESSGSGMRAYYRKASGTGSTVLKETEGGFSTVVAGWVEAAL